MIPAYGSPTTWAFVAVVMQHCGLAPPPCLACRCLLSIANAAWDWWQQQQGGPGR